MDAPKWLPSPLLPDRPADVWICCQCTSPGDILPFTSPNTFTLWGDDCPICSHHRCPTCDPPLDLSLAPQSIELPPPFHQPPHLTSEDDRKWFLSQFREYYFQPKIPWTDVCAAYNLWEWLQFYRGRVFPRLSDANDWFPNPVPGSWQCCRCFTFNEPSPDGQRPLDPSRHLRRPADRQTQECIKQDHRRCWLCFTQPEEGKPLHWGPR